MNNYNWLISRLDAFIRKYYANQLIRGSLVLLICLLFYILTISLGEYYFYLPVWLKVTLVSLFVVLGSVALIAWVIIPLSKMWRFGKVISHEQAAAIVGKHFPEISDKLLNILQLKKQNDGYTSRALLEASIDQKAAQISVVPITGAVDLSKNRRYIPLLLPLMLIGTVILIFSPRVFTDASERLLQPTKEFVKPAPFDFIVKSLPLQAVRNTDFHLQVEVKGSVLPAEMSIDLNGDKVPMQAVEGNKFQYTFKNVTDDVKFRLYAADFYSQEYTIKVAQKPVLKSFKVQINYPDYTGKKDEVRTSLGDMTVPAGTVVSLAFMAEHTDEATIRLGEGATAKLTKQGNMFASQYRFMNDTSYTLALKNKKTAVTDSFKYNVTVTPDQFPVIQLQEFRDTISGKQILLSGTAGDDYAITKVLFHYQITDPQNRELAKKSISLKATAGALSTFQHYFDIKVLNLKQGQKLSYYIEAWDNDGVNGSKASRSEVMSYHMYTPDQLDSAINQNAEMINSGLNNSSQQTKELQSEYKDLQSKMLQSESMEWEQQQSLQEVNKMQQQLQAQMEAVKKRLDEQIQQSKQKEYSQDLKDKQEELQKQMDNLLNKELAEQMKKLAELMQKLNKDQAFQTMKQLEQENKVFNMDLQRMQELMQKMEMQMRMEDMANKMDDLAKKQLELKDQTDNNKKDNAALSKEQDALKKELDKTLSQDMKEMQDLNKQMKQGQDLSKSNEAGKDAQQEMQDSKEQLDQKKNSQSSQSQSKAAQNLQKMAQSMRSKGGGGGGPSAPQLDIDIKAIRQLLTNLMRLSFDQEQLMKKVQATAASSQAYLGNQKEQNRLHNNSKMVRDSLYVLSKRLFQLSATVNKETSELEANMSASHSALENRRVGDALTRQQYVMTHTNNLALMLNEVLSALMQQQSQMEGSSGACSSPGGKKPSESPGQQLGDIITEQQNLGNAMQQMQQTQQRGKGPQQGKGQQGEGQQQGEEGNGQQQGDKQGSNNGEYGNAEQLARLAEQQAAIRRQLQQLNSLLNSKGLGGNAKELKEIQEKMDRNETDLVNKRTTSSELLLRQKEILSRLMQAEKSLREQEQDEKRSSQSAQDISRSVPPELQKYIQDRQKLLELYKTVPPQLKPYYRNMVEQYYQMIGSK